MGYSPNKFFVKRSQTITPESNLIIDYYELETGCFQVFIAGEDKPVSVSKLNVITWVQEQERLNCVTT
ncbi:MAG: hypothetical protein RM049_20255 [Nostoc sp. DedQUE04]|uniref:hypothetical protein n=1 Tax=Nostoc sp. DedQUE04 TaxID=3075390 RepID=UPI002AD4C0C8|nr:hypothetical protein [Nostoc sp. DedQUE04]MDZ8137604.1 hypothetical protein [Nostoc sp. DedQUE04]